MTDIVSGLKNEDEESTGTFTPFDSKNFALFALSVMKEIQLSLPP